MIDSNPRNQGADYAAVGLTSFRDPHQRGSEQEDVGSPVLMVLSCHPDTHYSCIRVRPVSIILGHDPQNSITI